MIKNFFKLVLLLAVFINLPAFSKDNSGFLEVSDTPVKKVQQDTESAVEWGNIEKKDKIISKSQRKIDVIYPSKTINKLGISFPGNRGPNQLVIYTHQHGRRTGTNEFGKEAVVIGDTVVKLTGADTIIPNEGFVISGHGSAKKWISDNLKIGTKIRIDKQNSIIFAFTTIDSYRYCADMKIKEVEKIINSKRRIQKTTDNKKAREWLKKAKKELRSSKFSNSNSALEDAKRSMQYSQIALSYTLPYLEDELKGVWVRPNEKNEAEVERTLNAMQDLGVNAVFLETFFHGKTIFPSEVFRSKQYF